MSEHKGEGWPTPDEILVKAIRDALDVAACNEWDHDKISKMVFILTAALREVKL